MLRSIKNLFALAFANFNEMISPVSKEAYLEVEPVSGPPEPILPVDVHRPTCGNNDKSFIHVVKNSSTCAIDTSVNYSDCGVDCDPGPVAFTASAWESGSQLGPTNSDSLASSTGLSFDHNHNTMSSTCH